MSQGFAVLTCPVEIFALSQGATTKSVVHLAGSGSLIWQPGGTVDTLTPPTAITTAYSAAKDFDTLTLVWLLVAKQGAGLVVVQETDYPTNMDTVLGGTPTWAVLRRIEGDICYPIAPI